MKDNINYLYAAIQDKQSTIRAIDVKCGFLFVVIFYPVLHIDSVVGIHNALAGLSCFSYIFTISVLVLWVTSLWVLFKAVSSIPNPHEKIDGADSESSFYNGGLFRFSVLQYFLNVSPRSEKNIEEVKSSLPSSVDGIVDQLLCENLKLAYIRDSKMRRSNACFSLVLSWLGGGGVLWLIYMVAVG